MFWLELLAFITLIIIAEYDIMVAVSFYLPPDDERF